MAEPAYRTSILAEGFAFPECPRWHEGALWVSDMHTGEVSRVDPRTGVVDVVFQVPGSAAGLAFDGAAVLAVSMTDRAVYRWAGGRLDKFVDSRPLSPSRANELESDGHGGWYLGNVGFSLTRDPPRPTSLGRLTSDGRLTTVADDLLCPNGMAVAPDGSELLVAESYANRVTRFRIAPDGTLQDRETAVQLEEGAHPDGLDRDPSGGIWIAVMGSTEVRHVDRSGRETVRIQASQFAYACRLGADGRLYICTSQGLDIADLDRRPGRVEVFDPCAALPISEL